MDEMFTIREVAEKMKMSVSALYRYVERGEFPCVRIGSNLRFTQDHITAFLSRKAAVQQQDSPASPATPDIQALYDELP